MFVFHLFVCNSDTVGGQELTIEETSVPTAGQPYTLVCKSNITTSMLMWFTPNGEEIMTGDRVQVGDLIQEGGTTSRKLTITELTETDLGVYTCSSGAINVTKRVQLQGTPTLSMFSFL